MEKIILIAALLLAPWPAAAEKPAAPLPAAAPEKSTAATAAPERQQELPFEAARSTKTLQELLQEIEPADVSRKTRDIAKYSGDKAGKHNYKLALPGGAVWRLIWKVDQTDKMNKTTFRLKVTTPQIPDFVQETIKDLNPGEGMAFGTVNVCVNDGGEFFIEVEATKAKWQVVVQLNK